jgi:hypothetical protein
MMMEILRDDELNFSRMQESCGQLKWMLTVKRMLENKDSNGKSEPYTLG